MNIFEEVHEKDSWKGMKNEFDTYKEFLRF